VGSALAEERGTTWQGLREQLGLEHDMSQWQVGGGCDAAPPSVGRRTVVRTLIVAAVQLLKP
jgi:hypothetical protein